MPTDPNAEPKFGKYDVELEMIETELSEKLNTLYESADLTTQVEPGKVRLFGESQTPCVYTPEGWHELRITITEACGDDGVVPEKDENEGKKPWEVIKAMKGKPFAKKSK